MEQFFPDMGFADAERACGTGIRHAERTCGRWIPGALNCFKGAGCPHRTPALMAGIDAVPCASAARGPPGLLLAWNNSFGDMGFLDAERAYGAVLRHLPWPVLRHLPWPVLRHLPWPVLRHAKRNFFVRQHRLFDTPAPQPVAGRRRLPKRCFGSGCARPVATLKGAGEPHRPPALFAGIDAARQRQTDINPFIFMHLSAFSRPGTALGTVMFRRMRASARAEMRRRMRCGVLCAS